MQDSKTSYLKNREFEYYGRVCVCREVHEMNIQVDVELEETSDLIGNDTRNVEPSLARE